MYPTSNKHDELNQPTNEGQPDDEIKEERQVII